MEGFYQVWKIDHTATPKDEEPVSQPLPKPAAFLTAKFMMEDEFRETVESGRAAFRYSFVVRPVHPEERF